MRVINVVLNNCVYDRRVLSTARSLIKFGYDVKVVALHETGLNEQESVSGVPLHRMKLKTKHWPKSKVIQLAKFFEFLVRFSYRYRQADVIHCNDLSGLIVGVFCKLVKPRVRLVYDSHEFASNDVPYESRVSVGLKRLLEGFLIKFAKAVINVSPSMADEYSRIYRISRPYIVLNCPAYQSLEGTDLFRENLGIRRDQTIFLYQGGLQVGRGIPELLEVFKNLENDDNVLVLMGYGPLEAAIQRVIDDQANVFLHHAVAPDILLKYTASADFGISYIEDSCLSERFCLPNKLFEYLMAGLPVITSNLHEMRQFVEREGVGVVADENSVKGLRNAIEAALNIDRLAVGKKVIASRRKYCWAEQEKVLEEIYRAI